MPLFPCGGIDAMDSDLSLEENFIFRAKTALYLTKTVFYSTEKYGLDFFEFSLCNTKFYVPMFKRKI